MVGDTAAGLTSEEYRLEANVGETVRIFFWGRWAKLRIFLPRIGEIFDRVYPFGSITSEPLTDVQTISVQPGGAWIGNSPWMCQAITSSWITL